LPRRDVRVKEFLYGPVAIRFFAKILDAEHSRTCASSRTSKRRTDQSKPFSRGLLASAASLSPSDKEQIAGVVRHVLAGNPRLEPSSQGVRAHGVAGRLVSMGGAGEPLEYLGDSIP
jgi:hypothetical protein